MLLAASADPADIVHHAEAAGAENVVAEYALIAARRAAAVGSNREAYYHYRRASNFLDRRPASEQAAVLEELATAAYAVYRLEDAFPAIERAIAEWTALNDWAALGRCTLILSRLYWHVGDGDAARRKALEAVEILEPLGESVELARAYSGLSQLENLAESNERAIVWGERALELANRLGDETTRAHVLVNIASVKLDVDHRQTAPLLEAHGFADAVGNRHEATRALGNLGYALMSWAQPEPAFQHAERAVAYAEANEVHNLASYTAVTLAWLRLRAGEWDEAERITLGEIEKSMTVAQLVAKTVLAELAVRRGDPDAAERLAELAAQAVRTSEPQRIVPVLELEIEWALTRGTPMPHDRLGRLIKAVPERGKPAGWGAIRVAAWAAVAGVDVDVEEPRAAPYAAMLRRDWAGSGGRVRRRRVDLRPCPHAVARRRRGVAGRGARDRPRSRGRAADSARRRADARARAARSSRPAGGDPGESGGADRPPARGAGARHGRPDERGDRGAAGRVAEDRGAPRRRGADEARRHVAAGRRAARLRTGSGGAPLTSVCARF